MSMIFKLLHLPLVLRLLRVMAFPYWLLTRGMSLGVRAIVVNSNNQVLLVRHTYLPGWYLPGGGVERGESMVVSLKRELIEEANVNLTAEPQLVGLYNNPKLSKRDHVALYLCRDWQQETMPKPNMEIAECGFFDLDDLPEGTTSGTRMRLREVFSGGENSHSWS